MLATAVLVTVWAFRPTDREFDDLPADADSETTRDLAENHGAHVRQLASPMESECNGNTLLVLP
ncbi:hypothetical protein CH266_18115 [Rhodococcus sp. 06-1474-1B]|nr:hypothetical protein CH266_18115 [Rhodococcus sp. 06-1474-1B]